MDIEDYAREHPQLDEGDATAQVPSLVRGAFAALPRATSWTSDAEKVAFASLATGSARGWSVSICRRHGSRFLENAASTRPSGRQTSSTSRTASFDLVICCHVIEHVEDQLAVARELARVTRSDGLVYIGAPLRLRGAWYPYRLPNGGWGLDPTHVREYTSPTQLQTSVCKPE